MLMHSANLYGAHQVVRQIERCLHQAYFQKAGFLSTRLAVFSRPKTSDTELAPYLTSTQSSRELKHDDTSAVLETLGWSCCGDNHRTNDQPRLVSALC